jgi:hypothetical protein
LTPRSAGADGLPSFPLGYLGRIPRLASLWIDRDFGLLRWAPIVALACFAGWLLYVSRRDQLARVAPARREAESAAYLALGIIGAQLAVTAFAGAKVDAFPGVTLIAALPALAALTSWSLRHVPRWLAAVLTLITLGGSVWVVIASQTDGWLGTHSHAPWGPLVYVFPDFGGSPVWPAIACALLLGGAVALILHERRAAGEWRSYGVAAQR